MKAQALRIIQNKLYSISYLYRETLFDVQIDKTPTIQEQFQFERSRYRYAFATEMTLTDLILESFKIAYMWDTYPNVNCNSVTDYIFRTHEKSSTYREKILVKLSDRINEIFLHDYFMPEDAEIITTALQNIKKNHPGLFEKSFGKGLKAQFEGFYGEIIRRNPKLQRQLEEQQQAEKTKRLAWLVQIAIQDKSCMKKINELQVLLLAKRKGLPNDTDFNNLLYLDFNTYLAVLEIRYRLQQLEQKIDINDIPNADEVPNNSSLILPNLKYFLSYAYANVFLRHFEDDLIKFLSNTAKNTMTHGQIKKYTSTMKNYISGTLREANTILPIDTNKISLKEWNGLASATNVLLKDAYKMPALSTFTITKRVPLNNDEYNKQKDVWYSYTLSTELPEDQQYKIVASYTTKDRSAKRNLYIQIMRNIQNHIDWVKGAAEAQAQHIVEMPVEVLPIVPIEVSLESQASTTIDNRNELPQQAAEKSETTDVPAATPEQPKPSITAPHSPAFFGSSQVTTASTNPSDELTESPQQEDLLKPQNFTGYSLYQLPRPTIRELGKPQIKNREAKQLRRDDKRLSRDIGHFEL